MKTIATGGVSREPRKRCGTLFVERAARRTWRSVHGSDQGARACARWRALRCDAPQRVRSVGRRGPARRGWRAVDVSRADAGTSMAARTRAGACTLIAWEGRGRQVLATCSTTPSSSGAAESGCSRAEMSRRFALRFALIAFGLYHVPLLLNDYPSFGGGGLRDDGLAVDWGHVFGHIGVWVARTFFG